MTTQKNKTEGPRKGKPVKPKEPKGVSRVGRKKEKVQISVRIDKALMDLAYDHISRTGERITDYLERGVILALQEEVKTPLPAITSRVRFLIAHADPEEQVLVKNLLALLRLPRVRELNEVGQLIRNATMASLKLVPLPPLGEDGAYEKALAEFGEPPTPGPGQRREDLAAA